MSFVQPTWALQLSGTLAVADIACLEPAVDRPVTVVVGDWTPTATPRNERRLATDDGSHWSSRCRIPWRCGWRVSTIRADADGLLRRFKTSSKATFTTVRHPLPVVAVAEPANNRSATENRQSLNAVSLMTVLSTASLNPHQANRRSAFTHSPSGVIAMTSMKRPLPSNRHWNFLMPSLPLSTVPSIVVPDPVFLGFAVLI